MPITCITELIMHIIGLTWRSGWPWGGTAAEPDGLRKETGDATRWCGARPWPWLRSIIGEATRLELTEGGANCGRSCPSARGGDACTLGGGEECGPVCCLSIAWPGRAIRRSATQAADRFAGR